MKPGTSAWMHGGQPGDWLAMVVGGFIFSVGFVFGLVMGFFL